MTELTHAIEHFHFIRPAWLLSLIPFALLFYFQVNRVDMLQQWRAHVAPHLLQHLIVQGSQRRLYSPIGLMLFVAIPLAIALAGPSWKQKPSPFATDRASLIVAIDLSQSMAQSDVQPSRLMRVKQKVGDLLEQRGDAYTALIAYAGTAHTVIPLCNDRNVIGHYLDALDIGSLPREGKRPENVFKLIDGLVSHTDVPTTLLLITDGMTENSLPAFKHYFEDSQHRLLIWGIGKTQQTLNDEAVEGISSSIIPLQNAQLEALADTANGYYQPLTTDKNDIEKILRKINNAFALSEEESRPWQESGYVLIWPMLMIFLLWFRKGWTLQW